MEHRIAMGIRTGRARLAAVLFALASVLFALALEPAAPRAAVPERMFTVKGIEIPGPPELNRTYVHAFGSKKAENVLILMPGTFGGAADFDLVAKALAARDANLQVWAADRREQGLEDTEMFEKGLRGEASLQEVFDYYLGWLTKPGITEHVQFRQVTSPEYDYAKDWGMETHLEDMRRIVMRAKKMGKEVALGGHSVGASLAISYAAWDFDGRPGYKDLSGLVLIDGGLMGSFDPYNLPQAQEAMARMDEVGPFSDLLGIGIPETAGIFASVGGIFAHLAPDDPAATLDGFPLLPADLKPPVPATNLAFFAHDFDRDTSPPYLTSLHVNAGSLDTATTPASWTEGGITPATNLSWTFAQQPMNAVDWYFPTRITIDANGADQMRMNPVARYLGLRLMHTRQVDLPFYVIQTDDTGGDVLEGARNWIKRTKTTRRESVLVNKDPLMSHLDPLLAAPRKNAFVKTVGPFLRNAFE